MRMQDDEYERFKAHLARSRREQAEINLKVMIYFSWTITVGLLTASLIVLGTVSFNPISAFAYLMAPFAVLFTVVYLYQRIIRNRRKRKNR